jgi:hypothetical protein
VSWIIDVTKPYELVDHETVLGFIRNVSAKMKYGTYGVKMSAITFDKNVQEVSLDASDTFSDWMHNLKSVVPIQFGQNGSVEDMFEYLLSGASSLCGKGHGHRAGVPMIAFFMTDGYFTGRYSDLTKCGLNNIQYKLPNLHTHDYLAYSVNEVVIILDLGAMDVLCSFCRTIPRSTRAIVQSCNAVMEFEKIIGGKFKTSTLPCFQSVFTTQNFLVAGVRPWESHYLFWF